jgi:hypothetical protein
MSMLCCITTDLSSVETISLFALFIVVVSVTIRRLFKIYYPPNLPRVFDEGKPRFSFRTRLLYYKGLRGLVSKSI